MITVTERLKLGQINMDDMYSLNEGRQGKGNALCERASDDLELVLIFYPMPMEAMEEKRIVAYLTRLLKKGVKHEDKLTVKDWLIIDYISMRNTLHSGPSRRE